MPRSSEGGNLLATVKANQIAAQRRRTEARVQQLRSNDEQSSTASPLTVGVEPTLGTVAIARATAPTSIIEPPLATVVATAFAGTFVISDQPLPTIVVAPPSTAATGIWVSVELGPQQYLWSRSLIGGHQEHFSASLTASGHWELRHSSSH